MGATKYPHIMCTSDLYEYSRAVYVLVSICDDPCIELLIIFNCWIVLLLARCCLRLTLCPLTNYISQHNLLAADGLINCLMDQVIPLNSNFFLNLSS
jgi:hypothetical protein